MLEVVTESRRIGAAVRRLRRRLGGVPSRGVTLSWAGGGRVVADIHWLRDHGFWWRHDATTRADRHGLTFGYAPSVPGRHESATCEINLPVSGADRRLAGAILRDADGALYLAHSGRIGGVRPGRGRDGLRAVLAGGHWQGVRWPAGRTGEMLVLAPIDGPRLARQIGRFVAAVHRYKRDGDDAPVVAPRLVARDDPAADSGNGADAESARHAALCDRGLVLDALGEELRRRGLRDGDAAGAGDPLFAARGGGARLVDVETDLSPATLERAVGRLLLRRAGSPADARAALVVPAEDAPAALDGLSRHGIAVVRYRWRGARPVFDGLDDALA
ncbi:MAG: hypothetical protein IPK81_04475 [Rhodospirillales bacterium]|nr:MAG: hypothetical protein IPK81_04475 [Rhodospirillales bacterium]